MNQLVFIENNRPVTDSLMIAESFGKEHRRVLQDIRELECSKEFSLHHFVQSTYNNDRGREYERFLITQDGFAFLVMGYTGKEAARFKEIYIGEFNRMREQLIKPQYTLPQSMAEALRLAADLSEENERVKRQNEQLAIESSTQKQKLKEQETPVAIYNLAIAAHNTMSMQEVAKALGTGRTRLYDILREEGLIMRGSTLPYQRYIDSGYFKVSERPRASGDLIVNDPATRVYAKGFDYIARLMQKRAERSGQGA